MKMKKRKRLCIQITCLVLGLTLSLLGLVLLIFLEPIYDRIVTEAMKFQEGTPAYQAWRTNVPPLDMDVYLFNWTNPEDVNDVNIKPRFNRVGPYSFKECREKINITWNGNNTVSYGHKKMYHYNPARSARPLDDEITTINAVPLTIGYKIRDKGYFAKKVASVALGGLSSLHVTTTAGRILFDGFDDAILGILNIASLGTIRDKFGLFYGTNGSMGKDGYYSMYYKNDDQFGTITQWNYGTNSGYYSDHCSQIKGSAGEFYPINQNRTSIMLYSPELCRYAILEYEKDVVVKGIKGYKFTARYIFDNGTLRPENRCFCDGECVPSGVFNVSRCRDESPTFLSFPNFWAADPYYYTNIEGLYPDDERDEFFIVLEPKTGIVIDFAARMQLNMLLQPIDDLPLYEDVQKVFIPIFYFDQKVTVKDHLVLSIKLLQIFPEITTGLAFTLLTLALIVFVGLLISLFYDCNCLKEKMVIEVIKQPKEEIPLKNPKMVVLSDKF